MFAPDTKKRKIWKYFDHINRDKTFSTVICNFCSYSTYYSGNTSKLRAHLNQHQDKIMQLEADSQYLNPSASNDNRTEKITADNKQITHDKDESTHVEMNSSSKDLNPSTSNHNRTQRIAVGDSKQITSSLSQIMSKNTYIFSMQNNQRFLQFMKQFNEDYTSLDIDDLRRKCFLGKTLASAQFIHLAIDVKRDHDQLWFIVNAYSHVKNEVWHEVLFVAPCQLENALEHVCRRVLEVAKAYNIIHKIKTVVSNDEEFVSYFTKVKEVNIKNCKILFYFKHTLMNIVNSAMHNFNVISSSIVTTKQLLQDIVDQENSRTTPIDERMNKDLDTLYFYLCKVSKFLRTLEPSQKINLILEITDVLKDVHKTQDEIHMISEVSPKLFKMVIDLETRYNLLQDATQVLCTNLQLKLIDFLNDWKDITIYATATLLDPRFRTTKFAIKPDEWIKKILCQLIENLKTNLNKNWFDANVLDNTKEETTLTDEFQRYILQLITVVYIP